MADIDNNERVCNVIDLIDSLILASNACAVRAYEVAEASEAGDEERAVALLAASCAGAQRALELAGTLQANGVVLFMSIGDGSEGDDGSELN